MPDELVTVHDTNTKLLQQCLERDKVSQGAHMVKEVKSMA